MTPNCHRAICQHLPRFVPVSACGIDLGGYDIGLLANRYLWGIGKTGRTAQAKAVTFAEIICPAMTM